MWVLVATGQVQMMVHKWMLYNVDWAKDEKASLHPGETFEYVHPSGITMNASPAPTEFTSPLHWKLGDRHRQPGGVISSVLLVLNTLN